MGVVDDDCLEKWRVSLFPGRRIILLQADSGFRFRGFRGVFHCEMKQKPNKPL